MAILLANCMTHGRRQFVDQIENFPEACRHVLEVLGEVYLNDRTARQLDLSGEERLKFHQEHSGHLMDRLREWMTWQQETKQVKPNSGLGKAINYFLKRWDALTLFLRVPGGPAG
ncbi:MAG: transposase [Candidatus Eremiobacterota bacterium]